MKSITQNLFAASARPLGIAVREASNTSTAAETAADLAQRIDRWVDTAPATEMSDRIEVHRRIIRCFERGEKRIDLSHLAITSLPDAIGHVQKLEHLDVMNARLSEVPAEVGSLRRLKCLHLAGNDLCHLPPELENLKNLRRLFLNNNKFQELPIWIGKLQRLELLHTPHNQLSQVPVTLIEMPSLTDLDLRNNKIAELPPWLAGLNLRYLDVSANPLKDIKDFTEGARTLRAFLR